MPKAAVSPLLQAHREEAYEQVADAVSRAMTRVGSNEMTRRIGRHMGRTLASLQRGTNVTVATLSDIAVVTGTTLKITLE